MTVEEAAGSHAIYVSRPDVVAAAHRKGRFRGELGFALSPAP